MLNKLKNLFLVFKENVFEKYPVTMWSIWIASVLTAIVCDEPDDAGTIMRWLIKLTIFLWSFAVGAFYTEECLKKYESADSINDFWQDNAGPVIGFAVAAVAAAGVVFFGFYEAETLFGVQRDVALEYIGKFYVCFYAWVSVLTVYHIFRSGAESFEKFVISVVGNSVKTSVVYGLFALGVLFLVLIIEALLFDTGTFLERIELLLAGAIYVPGMILAVSRIKDTPEKFFSLVVKFVLLPLTLAAFVIIYVYILKLIVTWSLPSNEVFGILTALFVCGFPIWTMASYYEDSKLGKIAGYLPYAFVPFIILQIICIGLRIGQYGLTGERYMGCLLIVFEILYLVIYSICQRKYLSRVMMVLAGLLTVYLIAPLVNCDRMVFQSQKNRVEKYICLSDAERDNLSAEEKKALCGAYRALSYTRLGEEYIDRMQQNDIRWIEECGDSVGDYYVNDSKSVYVHHDLKSWNVEGYSSMYEVSGRWDDKETNGKIDVSSFEIIISENKEMKIAVDLTGFIKEIEEEYDRSNNGNLNEWLAGHNEIEYSDSKLIIEYVRAQWDGDDISELYISGYYLQ